MGMIGISLWAGIIWVGIAPAGVWPLSWQAQHRIAQWEDAREDAERDKVRTLAEYREYILSRPHLTPELKKLLIDSEEFRTRMAEKSEREHREFMDQLERDHQTAMERLRRLKREQERNPPPTPTRRFLQ